MRSLPEIIRVNIEAEKAIKRKQNQSFRARIRYEATLLEAEVGEMSSAQIQEKARHIEQLASGIRDV